MGIHIRTSQWGILGFFSVCISLCILLAALFIGFSLIIFNDYEATASIVVMHSISSGIGQISAADPDAAAERELRTVAAAIKSHYMLEEVVKKLNLAQAFSGENAINVLERIVRVNPIRGTHIINITVRYPKPELATQIANTLTRMVLEDFTKKRFAFEKDMAQWLTGQAAELRMQVEEAARQLREFRTETGAGDIRAEYDALSSYIKNLQINLAGIKTELKKAEIFYHSIKSRLDAGVPPEELPEVRADDSYREVSSEYLVLQNQIKTLLDRYNPDHPDILERQVKLRAGERIMAARAKTIIDDAMNNKAFFLAKSRETEQLLADREKALREMEQGLDQYAALLNNLNEKETMYNALIDRIDNEYERLGLSVWQADLVDQAYLPHKKNRPPARFLIFLALAATLIITAIYSRIKSQPGIGKTEIKTKEKTVQGKGMYIERVKEDN